MSRLMRRLAKEVEETKNLFEENGILARPIDENDLTKWEAFIPGPTESPYDGFIYKLSIVYPQDFPMRAPIINFTTKMFHPNVSFDSGSICLDILKSQWSPVLTLPKILLSISSLLTDPNASSPLNGTAASQWNRDRAEYTKTVQKYGEIHALTEMPK